MAVSWNFIKNEYLYTGLSSDIKPDSPPVGSKFWETDTDKIFVYSGGAWDSNYADPIAIRDGESVIIKGVSGAEDYPIVSDDRGYMIPLDYIHAAVHDKIVYTISYTFLNVATNGFSRIRLKTGSKALHFEINYNADLKCRLKTYSAPTITANGTLFQPFNRIIGYGNGIQEFQVYLNPTFTGGTLRASDFIGSQTPGGVGSATRAGGGRNGGIESVLTPNQEYIIEFQNVGSDVSDIGVIINCYERPYIA